jgi:hypothetical protein
MAFVAGQTKGDASLKLHTSFCLLALAATTCAAAETRPPDIPFAVHTLDIGASETAAVADINRDGRLDIISGENWYEAPSWKKHPFRQLRFWHNYVDAFSDLPLDVDGDGWVDIVSVKYFDQKIVWYRNPGKSSAPWQEAVIHEGFRVEYAILADVDNDGRANELVPLEFGAPQAWYEAKGGTWIRHVITEQPTEHGIGVGDINKDGRNDVLTPRGWLEAPPDPRSENWVLHPAWEAVNPPVSASSWTDAERLPSPPVAMLSFMHVVDVNGDGRNDVITASAHDYGVFWFEQGADGRWTRHMIDRAWSQGHASTLVDLNGDGRPDFLTGKRLVFHGDPGEREPLGIYWYEYHKADAPPAHESAAEAGVEWIRHIVQYGGQISAGVQIPAIDIDGDGDLDIVCPGQAGLFLLENLTKHASTRNRVP